MTRRRLVALVAAIVFVLLGIVGVSTILFLTRSDYGREQLRSLAQHYANKLPGGTMYIGKLSGSFITELTIDSIAIRDKRGDLFLSTGRVTLSYDPRDLIDQRLFVRRAQVEHPYLHMVQHTNGVWNFKEIFASQKPVAKILSEANRRGWGDYVVVDSARMRDATFLMTLSWHPDDSLRGPVRDSVIRVHLTNPEKAVARTFDGFGRTYAWRNAHGLLVHARIADPDSDKVGRVFRVDSLAADEFEPTFKFRNVRGDIRNLGDSVWFQIPHFNMPGSTGNGHGKVWWGSDLPTRYDIAIRGDSVSLDDVNWVYPMLPRTGGGSLDLFIRNQDPKSLDPKILQIVDFKLSKMDVRSTKSHLVGDMSFGIGAPVLLVRNVNLRADPIDFDLIRTLNGKKFPVDWQGQITGTARGRGGPLTHFVVDDARGTFADAHVKGAVSRFSGKGELDILVPANTTFHGFNVDVASLDLRSIEYLYPAFPRLGGFIFGTATLDSSYLDVRFSNANVTHQDGPGEPSRFTGNGRVTYGDPFMIYDVALEAQPLSLTMLARSYPNPLRGLVSGPITAKGSSPDLEVAMSLKNAAGGLSFDGRLDIDSIGGMGARGRGQFSTANLGGLLETRNFLVGPLGVHYDVDLAGYSLTDPTLLHGTAALDVERTVLDGIRVYRTPLRVHFADGQMKIDSGRVHTDAVMLEFEGGIGLPKTAARDSISFSVNIDSLGGLRPYLASSDTAKAASDSLSGTARASGHLTGTLDRLNVRAELTANKLYWNKDQGERLALNVDLRDALGNISGTANARVDSVTYAGIAFDTVGGRLRLDDSTRAGFTAGALSRNGFVASTTGNWTKLGTLNTFGIDSLGLSIGDSRWRLAAPSRFALDPVGMRLDSLVLRNRDSAVVAAAFNVPDSGAATAAFRALHVPLRDLGQLAQLADTIDGTASATATITGTKAKPRIVANAELSSVRAYGVDVDQATIPVRFSDGRFDLGLDLIRKGRRAVTASANIPADVTLFSIRQRDDSIRGSIVADTTDLALLNPLLKAAKTTLSGQLTANVIVSGTTRAPAVEGGVTIKNGTAKVDATGVKISGINGSALGVRSATGQDSISVQLHAVGDGKAGGSVDLTGYAKNLFQVKNQGSFVVTLAMNGFHAFNKRTVADLYVSTKDTSGRLVPIRLSGTTDKPVLTGRILVDRGSIFLADRELARKQAVEIFADNATPAPASASTAMFSTLMSNLKIQDVTVSLGDVRLKSAEANVKLVGNLRLLTETSRSTRTVAATGELLPKLALEGSLATAGGTYNLNLGLVQREFQVLPGGTVTFDGPPENPNLDIQAQYTVRRAGDRDLGIIVSLNGPLLPYPGIDFSSNAGYEIAQSDLISYLLTSKPGFDFGQNQATQQLVASVLAPTISAFAADKLRNSLGSIVDLNFQLGASNAQGASVTSQAAQYLYGATIGAERQFRNVFLNVNTGFCQLANPSQSFNAFNALGAKAEYRFKPDLSMKLSYDPPTSTRVCNGSQGITGFAQTPWQFGLSLLHVWRF